jgi:hypothetical protein
VNRILERHPGELMALAFLAMGVGILLGVVVVEMIAPGAGHGFGGLIDGSGWQAGQFPAP